MSDDMKEDALSQHLESIKRDPDDRRRYTHYFILAAQVDNDGNITWSVEEGDIELRFNNGPVYDDFTDEWINYPLTAPIDKPSNDPLARDARHMLKDLCGKVGMDTESLGWDLSDPLPDEES